MYFWHTISGISLEYGFEHVTQPCAVYHRIIVQVWAVDDTRAAARLIFVTCCNHQIEALPTMLRKDGSNLDWFGFEAEICISKSRGKQERASWYLPQQCLGVSGC